MQHDEESPSQMFHPYLSLSLSLSLSAPPSLSSLSLFLSLPLSLVKLGTIPATANLPILPASTNALAAPGAIALLAYMFTIIRAAQEFEDPAWRNYDEAFHEKAAATGNPKWSEIDTLIYNRIFTGHAKKLALPSPGSPYGSNPTHTYTPPAASPMPQGQYTDLPPPKCPAPMSSSLSSPARIDVCYLFNRATCHYGRFWKFRHMCSICLGHHPKISCEARKPPPAEQGTREQGQPKP